MAETWKIKSLKGLKHSEFTRKPNSYLIPVTKLHFNKDNVDLFNKIYKEILSKDRFYTRIIRTKCGAISLTKPPGQALRQWDLRQSGFFTEITIINNDGCWRIQIAPGKKSSEMKGESIYSGRQAFYKFREILKEKFSIDLESYAIEDGETINHTIEKPLIYLFNERFNKNKVFERAHHIDFHNSYPAGLANTHKEFREAITYLYEHRYQKPSYKDLLNFSIGFMHSKYVGYKFAHLAKDAIMDSNKRVLALASRVQRAGGKIILYNTDGFWYTGEIFHGAGEGKGLGQWHNDHVNCRFRAKSSGAYEFIENETYNPVLRGYTELDKIKDRGNWSWGDIYQEDAAIKTYKFVEGEGFVEK